MQTTHIKKLLLASAIALGLGSGAAHAEVKIGLITTLSGGGAALGQDQRDGFMLAVEQNGGKLGGQDVSVIIEDDQLKPEQGVQIARKLVNNDKVDFVTGIIFSNVMMAARTPILDSKTFLIGSNAGPSPISGAECSPYFFSTSWNNDQLHEGGGQIATDQNYKKMYIMAPNYQAGKDALAGFKRFYKGEVVDEVYTQIGQMDYSVEIAQLQQANPDAVYVFYPGGMGVNFVKQYRQAGLLGKVPLISASTVDGSTLPALQDIALGVITHAPYAPNLDNAQNKQFVEAFEKKYNRSPSLYAAQSYDAANLIASAIKKVNGNLQDKEAVRKALEAADFDSVRGDFKYNTNHFPITDWYRVDVVKGENGKVELAAQGVVFKDHKDAYYEQCKM
ncbi:ABC transporter substrate-binding protein [Pusillimonas caeni]|uniref:ABC transporter substrate-binding protein n=1 Tax=Pusillimonas caeni TaxID=1348472 RepID=UPI000E59CBAE|nr:ABC transporter substrate-binding protein [Pusillimonas caeni]TFL14531.1 ABC transporter substrate-binding protein [Pusillimonas caeni]